MSIENFFLKYKDIQVKDINKISSKWIAEKRVDDFLGSAIFSGLLVGDSLIGDGFLDRINPDVKKAFTDLMGDKADTYSEIRDLIVAKYENSPESVEGLISKIQGQFGENEFLKNVGGLATLAESGSQKGWDVKIGNGFDAQYVQVKTVEDADVVIEAIENVNERISNGELPDIKTIDFAVNSEIFEEVKSKAIEKGLTNNILNIGATKEEIRDALTDNFELINDSNIFVDFFSEFFSSSLSVGAIHAASNAFLYWKGAKDKNKAIEDTIYSTAISSGGTATALITNTIFNNIGFLATLGPLGLISSFGVGYSTREFLKRIAMRRGTVDALSIDYEFNMKILERLKINRKNDELNNFTKIS